MPSIIVIFNGIKFPHHLMEYALRRAKEKSASIHCLFLRAKSENREGYGFPSDLAQSETLTGPEDALDDDQEIVKDQIKLARSMALSEGIVFTAEIKAGCTIKEILEIVENYDLICLDADFDPDTSFMLASDLFTSSELIECSPCEVELVSEHGKG